MTDELAASWVADRAAADDAARVLVKDCLGRSRLPVLIGIVLLVSVSGALMLGSALSQMGAAYLGAAAALVMVNVAGVVRLWRTTLRSVRIRFREGVVLASSFDDDRMRLQGPHSERAMAYSAVERVRVVGRWVLIKEWGMPGTIAFPLGLFPDEALQRVRASVDPLRVRQEIGDPGQRPRPNCPVVDAGHHQRRVQTLIDRSRPRSVREPGCRWTTARARRQA